MEPNKRFLIMGYQIYKFSDASEFAGETPTIEICENDLDWANAYNKWLSGKNPTDGKWKKVIAHTKPFVPKLAKESK